MHIARLWSQVEIHVHQSSLKRRKHEIRESSDARGPWFPMSGGSVGFLGDRSFLKPDSDEISVGNHAVQLLEGCVPQRT